MNEIQAICSPKVYCAQCDEIRGLNQPEIIEILNEPYLESQPKKDVYLGTCYEAKLARIKPDDITKGIAFATSVLIALRGLAEAGLDVWNLIKENFNFLPKKEQEVLKEFLTPEVNMVA